MPAWPPITVIGSATSATNDAGVRLSRCSAALIRGEQRQAQQAEAERRTARDPQQVVLDLGDVLRVRRDPACAGGLQPELQHADHEQQPHQRGKRAVAAGPSSRAATIV